MTAVVYAESSAILAWLLREPSGHLVRAHLAEAGTVVSSRLTLVECARSLRRALREGRLAEHDARAAQHALDEAAGQWVIMDLASDVMQRAEEDFPVEPVRALEALHLAAALVFHSNLGELTLLTLDERIRTNARMLGLAIA